MKQFRNPSSGANVMSLALILRQKVCRPRKGHCYIHLVKFNPWYLINNYIILSGVVQPFRALNKAVTSNRVS